MAFSSTLNCHTMAPMSAVLLAGRPRPLLESSFLTGSSPMALRVQRAAGGRSPLPRQATTPCQANLVSRFSRVVKVATVGYGDSTVKDLEDPRKMLDQVVTEMQTDLAKLIKASSQVFATQKMLESKYTSAQRTADEWQRRAEVAVRSGQDSLAREALQRKKVNQDTANVLKSQLDMHNKAHESLMNSIKVMQSKVSEAMAKKETLKARAASAEATRQLAADLNGVLSGLRTSDDGLAAFRRMEMKVEAMEAEAEAAGQLLPASDILEGRFLALEAGTPDDELLKLKTDMLAKGRLPTPEIASTSAQNDIQFEYRYRSY